MSDLDQTVYSGQGAPAPVSPLPPPPRPPRRPLLLVSGVGCLLLICVVLLAGLGIYLGRKQLNEIVADLLATTQGPMVTVAPALTPTSMPGLASATPTLEPSPTPESDPAAGTATPETTPAGATVVASSEPEFGPITFALGAETEDYTPIDPGISFQEGITEVHAIFEYSGMSPDFTWRRVWHLDGTEILQSSEPWAGAEAGVFDYFVNAAGDPLAPGEWMLELYVEEQLAISGTFTIQSGSPLVSTAVTAAPTLTATTAAAQAGASAATAAAALASPTAESTTAASPTVESTDTPAPEGQADTGVYKLVYTRWNGVQHNIYLADTSGQGEQLLVTRAAGPSWTPDGRYIFFYGEEAVDRQIRDGVEYVNPNYRVANGIVRLTMEPFPADVTQLDFFQGPGWNDGTARWANVSPNGQMVAYDANPVGQWRIYFLGTTANQQYSFQLDGEQGDWSPDSQKLAYRSGRGGSTGIWVSNRDDTGHVQITTNSSDSFPAWSPDGQTIVFSRDDGGDVDLYAVNPNGGNLRRLTNTPGPDTLPVFTPGGDIIFRSARNGLWSIWKMNANGDNQTQIIADAPVGNDWAYSRMDVVE